ncbi:MAG: hypothetical protein R3E79_60415 [Caldilineaceae bacterium]
MKRPVQQLFYWTPRVLGILFALFVSIFALDVFGAGYGFWGTLLALVIHLLPVFALLLGLALAWRWEWIGTVIFMGFSLWYLIAFGGRFPTSVYLLMAGPPFVMGVLFLIDWLYKAKLRTPV